MTADTAKKLSVTTETPKPPESGWGSSRSEPTLPRRTLFLIIAGLMTGLLLGAMDQTIVATAGPTIISDLGGLSLYAWVFSAYILTQTVSMPIFGKLSDLYGRRKFFMLGLAIFMIGSMLSGASQNIEEMILFRAIQGIGSGAFFPVAVAVVGVIFPPAQRGKVQGIFASVFGIAAVVGPSVGTFLVQAISWRWIFYINMPTGVASLILIYLGLRESKEVGAKPVLDWLGISALTSWIVLLLLGFLEGGSTFPWYSWQEAALFAGAIVLFGVFLLVERRAKEPVIPLSVFKIRTVSSASAAAFLRGIAFFGVITFIPLFVQGAMGGSINDGRNVLNALMFPIILGSLIGGQAVNRLGYRQITFAGLALMSFGMFFLTGLSSTSSIVQLMEIVAVIGLGVGITFSAVVLAIQYSVGKKQIGIASSLAQFMGNLGATIGLAILGTVQTNSFGTQLNSFLQKLPPQLQQQAAKYLGDPNLVSRVLATPEALAQVLAQNPAVAVFIPQLRNAFALSFVPVFRIGFAVSVVALVSSFFITGSLKQQIAVRDQTIAGNSEMEQGKEKEEGGIAPPTLG